MQFDIYFADTFIRHLSCPFFRRCLLTLCYISSIPHSFGQQLREKSPEICSASPDGASSTVQSLFIAMSVPESPCRNTGHLVCFCKPQKGLILKLQKTSLAPVGAKDEEERGKTFFARSESSFRRRQRSRQPESEVEGRLRIGC